MRLVGRLAAALIAGLTLLLPGTAAAAAALPCKPWTMRTIASGLGTLENVLPDGRGGLLISATDQGAILRMTPDGQFTPLVPGVNAPGGLRLEGDLLYFNTGDALASGVRNTPDGTIDVFDLGTGVRSTFARDLTMPNGLAVLPNGDFVVSRDLSGGNTGITRVPRSDPGHPQTKWAAVSDSNGMAVDPTGTWLYSVETFSADANVYRIRIADPKQVEVVASLGNVVPPKGPDDMTIDGAGILYIAANAAGQVIRLDPRDKSVCVIASGMMNTSAVKFGSGPGWPESHLFVVGFDGVVRDLTPPADQIPVPAGPQPPPATTQPIVLSASPKTIKRGKRSCVRFRARSGGGVLPGTRIRFAGKTATSDAAGKARICVKPRRAGSLTAKASKTGYRSGQARVRVRASVPTAAAAKTCHLSLTQQRHAGATYLVQLSVSGGVSCSSGLTLEKAWQSCRRSTSGHTTCKRSVSGYRCSQKVLDSSKTQYDAKVSCASGARKVTFIYTQNK